MNEHPWPSAEGHFMRRPSECRRSSECRRPLSPRRSKGLVLKIAGETLDEIRELRGPPLRSSSKVSTEEKERVETNADRCGVE